MGHRRQGFWAHLADTSAFLRHHKPVLGLGLIQNGSDNAVVNHVFHSIHLYALRTLMAFLTSLHRISALICSNVEVVFSLGYTKFRVL
jgi:hypothetical protein